MDGEVGALLRREGLYSSHLAEWRAAQARGELAGAVAKRRGPKATALHLDVKRVLQLERENRRLRARAERAEALVEVQKNSRPCCTKTTGRAPDGPDADRPRAGPAAGDRAHLPGAPPGAGELLPGPAAPPARAATARGSGPGAGGAAGRPRGAACGAVRGSGASGGLRHPARRGAVPLFGAHDVPAPGGSPRGPGAPRRPAAPGVRGARAVGDAAERAVELGYHQAVGAHDVDLLLPVRDPGRVQPLRRGLVGGAPRGGGPGRAADRRDL